LVSPDRSLAQRRGVGAAAPDTAAPDRWLRDRTGPWAWVLVLGVVVLDVVVLDVVVLGVVVLGVVVLGVVVLGVVILGPATWLRRCGRDF
jgi:hypothetical protein